LNIGIENGPTPFLQDAGSREIAINPVVGSEVVILECPEGMARSPKAFAEANGTIFNKTAAIVFYDVLFEDTLGNRLPLALGANIGANSVSSFSYGITDEVLVILNPGEKIVLLTNAAP
jgi:hypothetical protein